MTRLINDNEWRSLGARLKVRGCRMDIDDVLSVVEGVAAAPEALDASAWLTLVDECRDLDGETRSILRDMVARTRAANALVLKPRCGDRLRRLRAELKRRRLGGFIIPRADEFQGETVPLRTERLAWTTGFTGSAGMAVILPDDAAVFVDGRYTLQVATEVDRAYFQIHHLIENPPSEWIAENLKAKVRLGYDPWLMTPAQVDIYAAAAAKAGGRLVACADNPIDAIWDDQPPPPLSPVRRLEDEYTGLRASEKCRILAQDLKRANLKAVFLGAPDSIAWLLNLRGGDVPFSPLVLAFAILHDDASVDLFVDPRKLPDSLTKSLGDAIRVCPLDSLGPALDRIGAAKSPVGISRDAAPAWVDQRLRSAGARVAWHPDPCAIPKARKNKTEMSGIREAHRRDGATLCRFLNWLDGALAHGTVRESEAAARLEALRREDPSYWGASFATIAGAGPNGAIVHYRLSAETDRRLDRGTLFLLDSGGQYTDGTTDVTRTLAIGDPSDDMRARFTLVLKGHIALASARFPKGTTGSQLDALARRPLWEAGLDYDHGTGHGVGCFLSVHEGPVRISKFANRTPLEPGMVLSNEPGFYAPGAYGIRIENLLTVVDGETGANERPFLAFETLTLAPIDRTLIRTDLMTPAEIAWLESYHARVRTELKPLLDKATAAWLTRATAPLG